MERAKDVHPLIMIPAFGIFDVTPSKSDLDVDVSPQRDHMIRDSHFRTAREAMQRALVNLFETVGQSCVQQVQDAIVTIPDLPTKIERTKALLDKYSFINILTGYPLHSSSGVWRSESAAPMMMR